MSVSGWLKLFFEHGCDVGVVILLSDLGDHWMGCDVQFVVVWINNLMKVLFFFIVLFIQINRRNFFLLWWFAFYMRLELFKLIEVIKSHIHLGVSFMATTWMSSFFFSMYYHWYLHIWLGISLLLVSIDRCILLLRISCSLCWGILCILWP